MSSLDALAEERKKRLAQLKSLKRKPEEQAGEDASAEESTGIRLSGRNYDPDERAPKMGFTYAPNEGQETIEANAEAIVEVVKAQQAEEEVAENPIDLFNLQPKKPNWDLKRDVEKKLERLKPRTKAAIAKLVRERINNEKAKSAAEGREGTGDDAANSVVEGRLAELVREREKERDEEDEDAA